jgi:diguanylate cyclase (GGDEF)-like protein
VIIGASAVELRDFFVVPRYGPIPGALLQAIAGESLIQGRALRPTPTWPLLAGIGLLGILAVFGRRRMPMLLAVLAAAGVSAAAEATGFALQEQHALLLDTGALHAAALAFVASVLGSELVRRGEQRLRAIRERDTVRRILDRVIADNFDGVVVVNAEGRIVSASQFAETTFGSALQDHKAADVLPEKFVALLTDALAANDRHGELTLHLGDADRVLDYVVTHSQVQLAAVPTTVACLTFRDITERRRDEDRLRYLGTHDTLTGALTRTRLIELMAAAFEAGRDVAVAIVDLRRFRIINDTLGHSQGDLLLKQVVSRLTSMAPDASARLGVDRFALLLPAMAPEKLTGFCETVCQWLAFPYQLAGEHQAIISASAGATCSLVSGHVPEMLLSHADMALSAAKQHVAGVTLFLPEMDQRLQERQAMDTALRRAMARREFTLAFQPQVDTTTGSIVGAEALARWSDPILGSISPVRFIPAAEETGLIVELGRWALNAACTEAGRWPEHIHIAVNVSPVQFELSDVVADVREALERTGLDPRRLELEMTEGIFVRDLEAVTLRLDALRELGVRIALDDFGTGYSSLSYLGRLPVDKIKIDQSFVKRLPDTEAAAIINTVVALSQTLGKQVIAEGVETADQAWMLQLVGCRLVQGFHFGRPVSAGEFAAARAEAPAARAISA